MNALSDSLSFTSYSRHRIEIYNASEKRMVDAKKPEKREYRAVEIKLVPELSSLSVLLMNVGATDGGLVGSQKLSEPVTAPMQTSTSSSSPTSLTTSWRKRNREMPFGPVPPPPPLTTGSVLKQTPLPRHHRQSSFITHAVQFPVRRGQGSPVVGLIVGRTVGRAVGVPVGGSVNSNMVIAARSPSSWT